MMDWETWAKVYPAKIVDVKPKAPWYVSQDYIDAVKAQDSHEVMEEMACEVIQFESMYYVIPKL